MIKFLIFAVIAYIFGSLPCGVWLGKGVKNIDIREYGSKNSGATNAYRILGPKYGIMVLILDALKGYIPLYIASLFDIGGIYIILLGLVAILGHTFSFFLQFKGGKGVATSLGVFLFLMPKVVGVLVLVFILVVGISKYISLGSVICAGLLPILAYFMPVRDDATRLPLVVISLIVGIFVIYKHKANIQRLMEGKENKFNLK
ncbi:glycerol-3-phosphate 1-O-acyltransferase PlsY [Cetobacterium somerae]|uniref:Glycerol-3-phosphate acyltransferase n=1 Tax=Cetobacterium somerae ATCC BAA-474 TaxID=1319815 RepID=U7VER3_9FUSO|nr:MULTISPECIES: glycerol-3-phosphate 1-O-acyltransferase PlsY [Cetobacterium]ERT70020.1 acyl-phosphate glycerol 3-phosphate acyltransferase [Cetobacterium somerae ATCC BAA-474]MBC2853779.1 glycerol-3-phosphate 1-O-acyltransferase PlsY [Cetobacterium sp. 2G large]MCQ9626649.1 glycerol-3-phosphate 1-O-acyltransferase PlsY [Cetobacterium somerae]WVJ02102.1 glycerol-3-phosphate 1-O-acyltransferase PlsY [Cetobacterium somerae]